MAIPVYTLQRADAGLTVGQARMLSWKPRRQVSHFLFQPTDTFFAEVRDRGWDWSEPTARTETFLDTEDWALAWQGQRLQRTVAAGHATHTLDYAAVRRGMCRSEQDVLDAEDLEYVQRQVPGLRAFASFGVRRHHLRGAACVFMDAVLPERGAAFAVGVLMSARIDPVFDGLRLSPSIADHAMAHAPGVPPGLRPRRAPGQPSHRAWLGRS